MSTEQVPRPEDEQPNDEPQLSDFMRTAASSAKGVLVTGVNTPTRRALSQPLGGAPVSEQIFDAWEQGDNDTPRALHEHYPPAGS